MRNCKPFATPSRDDFITESRSAFDISGSVKDFLVYVNALIRSDKESHVEQGLNYIISNIKDYDENDRKQAEFLVLLAYYRLKKDDELLERSKTAEKDGIFGEESEAIVKALLKEKSFEKKTDIALIITPIIIGLAATCCGLFYYRKKRH